MNITFHFEDHGQDFLTWTVTPNGQIIACEPFQFGIWSKWTVVHAKSYKAGDYVTITKRQGKGSKTMEIKYPLESVNP